MGHRTSKCVSRHKSMLKQRPIKVGVFLCYVRRTAIGMVRIRFCTRNCDATGVMSQLHCITRWTTTQFTELYNQIVGMSDALPKIPLGRQSNP